MINDKIKTLGELEIILRDKDGNIKVQKTVPNLVVTEGKRVIASRLVGTASAIMSHMAVGTSSTGQVAADTTLGAEIALSRTALTSGTSSNNEVTYIATFPAGTGTGAITEAGIFNASTAGSMICRTTFAVVNKDIGDALTINWKITIS